MRIQTTNNYQVKNSQNFGSIRTTPDCVQKIITKIAASQMNDTIFTPKFEHVTSGSVHLFYNESRRELTHVLLEKDIDKLTAADLIDKLMD